MNSYKDLQVWQKGIELANEVYKLTAKFPSDERFELTSQMRRCAISIPSNIAEGFVRKGDKEFRQFISIAYGSGAELETQLELAKTFEFASENRFEKMESLILEVMKMLNSLRDKLSADAKG